MLNMKVAIQGIIGSFHHTVAENYFGREIEFDECMTFTEMPDKVVDEKVDVAVMAIENSIAGAILPNYALIDEAEVEIVGEYYLQIQQNLMALPGQKIDDLQRVMSHPMALLQCKQFFKNQPHIRLVQDKDTAEVAKRIKEEGLVGVGAIASKRACEIYGLEMLAPEIQTIKNNATRFFIVQKKGGEKIENPTKASIKFILKHETGSLADVLNQLAMYHVNMSKIQSMPIIEKPWEYAFFVDLVFEDYTEYKNAIKAMELKTESLKVLGEYKKNKK